MARQMVTAEDLAAAVDRIRRELEQQRIAAQAVYLRSHFEDVSAEDFAHADHCQGYADGMERALNIVLGLVPEEA